MRKYLLSICALICLLASQCMSQVYKTVDPEEPGDFSYKAITCTTINSGQSCVPGSGEFPVAGVMVTLSIQPSTCGTGWHSHECTTGTRPPVVLRPGSINQSWTAPTSTDGWVHWNTTGMKWSGEYKITMTPQLKPGYPPFPVKEYKLYAGVTVKDKNGNRQTFRPFFGSTGYTYPSTPDARHLDAQGRPGNSLEGTRSCVMALEKAVVAYHIAFFNPYSYPVGIDRISLPDGGPADNEIDANGQYLFNSPPYQYWFTRKAERHDRGVEVDVLNPRASSPDNDAMAMQIFNAWEAAAYRAGWRLGRQKATGETIALSREQAKTYWANQPMVHMVCVKDLIMNQF